MPLRAIFCGSCGERIKRQKNEEQKARAENGDADAQGQGLDVTVRILPLSAIEAQKFGTVPKSETWGWLPVLSLTSAAGLFLVALAYEAGRLSSSWGQPLFWVGMGVLYLPMAWYLFLSGPSRRERLALLVVLSMMLYFVKFLQYPLYFTYFDEFTHWRTAQDIIATGHLFQENPLLPISSYYPGLEIVTTAISSLTGLSLFASGILLIGVARLVLVLALYLFYEHFTNSARAAGIATVLYMANPAFLFFDADFSYESFALPLAIFVLFAMALRDSRPPGRSSRHRGLILAICLGLGAVVITHHVTSYALVAFLVLWTATWAVTYFYQRPTQKDHVSPSPGGIALLGLVLSSAWLVYTGNRSIHYIGQYFVSAIQQLAQILAGERASRQLFQNTAGIGLPVWERVIALSSVALILLALPFGLYQVWRHHRTGAAALALAVGALAYPVGQVFRLTPSGAELGNRTTEFTFLGIAFILAIGATKFWFARTVGWRRNALVLGTVGIIFFGQLILGTGAPGAPLPGPYQVSDDELSIQTESIDAAEWAGSYLGPNHRIAADRDNGLLLATYGNEWVVTNVNSEKSVAGVFISPQIDPIVEAILQQDSIQYLLVDLRLSTGLPVVGSYYDLPDTQRIDPAVLAKFDNVRGVSRVFDSGDIVIYNVEALSSTPPSTAPAQTPSCPSAPSATVPTSYPKVARLYTGTIFDKSTSRATKMSLTSIQQQQGNLCGLFTGLGETGTFKRSITANGNIQFRVTNQSGQTLLTLDGLLQPDGTLAGSYCRGVASQCSDYGLWNLSPGT